MLKAVIKYWSFLHVGPRLLFYFLNFSCGPLTLKSISCFEGSDVYLYGTSLSSSAKTQEGFYFVSFNPSPKTIQLHPF